LSELLNQLFKKWFSKLSICLEIVSLSVQKDGGSDGTPEPAQNIAHRIAAAKDFLNWRIRVELIVSWAG